MEHGSVIVPVEDRRYRYQKCDVILIDFDPKVKKNRDFVSERSYSICAPLRDINSRREMTPQDSAARTASSQSQSQIMSRSVLVELGQGTSRVHSRLETRWKTHNTKRSEEKHINQLI